MVARIATPSHIARPLNYNEQKVKEGKAELLFAAGYLKDSDKLSFHDKLSRFERLISLSDAKTNSLHISLNFDNHDQLSKEKLVAIAIDYMERIGFGQQPYLVYQHFDSGHTHVHIVTTSIRADASRIDTYNIGRNQSEKARKEIEQIYSLVKAEGRRQQPYELQPVNAQKVQYGKSETKRAITNVLGVVLKQYKYASLPELNAILSQYNILADRGAEASRIYKSGGLVYRILNEQGEKVGVPVKASDLYNKPTLKALEEKFNLNTGAIKPSDKSRIKNAIDLIFLRNQNLSIGKLMDALARDGISVVLRKNSEGVIYGITYVDHRSKVVFNGSALGKQYSAKAIQGRCGGLQQDVARQGLNQENVAASQYALKDIAPTSQIHLPEALEKLLQPEEQPDYIPSALTKSKKKKRKRLSI